MRESTSSKVRRSQAEWRRLIGEQADSRQTQAVFCAARGISVSSFQNWKRRLVGEETRAGPWLELGTLVKAEAAGWDKLDLGDGVCLRLRRC